MTAPVTQFKADARRVAADLRHRGIIQTAMQKYEVVRDKDIARRKNFTGS